MTAPFRRDLICWVALLGIGLGWGSTQLFSKLVMMEAHHPLGVSLNGTILGSVMITMLLVARSQRLPLQRRHLVFYGICGIAGTALPHTLGYAAIRELPVGIVSILIVLVPMMTFLASVFLKMERAEPRRIFGLFLGAVAILLLVVPDTSLPEPEKAIWVVLPTIQAIAYTVENIYIARAQPKDCDPVQTMCGLFWAALLMQLPLVALSETWMSVGYFDLSEVSLFATTIMHVGAYTGFIWLIGRAGPVFAAQAGYLVTLSGVLLGIVVIGESHSNWVWVSLALMLTGLSLVQPRQEPFTRDTPAA